MLVFLDDSGDPGFKFRSGSTKYFVIAMVLFEDPLDAERAALLIKELRRDLGWSQETEFRFFKTKDEYRRRFFETIHPCRFSVRALVVDKEKLYSPELRSSKNSFYAYFIKQALKYHGGAFSQARIKIDGGGNREFRRQFQTYLRRELNADGKETMQHCSFVDSRSNSLIQMADMVAGGIHRSLQEDKKDQKTYISFLQSHIQNIWHFK